MTYTATEDIGDYKKGDIVPDEIAVVWENMYKTSPVKKSKSEVSKSDSKPEKKSETLVNTVKEKLSGDKTNKK